jgi:DNA-binding FadR family transcriptional regulator
MIEDGSYAEGALLPSEGELMQMFGVGRPSIREALFALHLTGMVAITSGERARVTVPSPDTLLFHLSGVARHFLGKTGGPEHFQEARAIFEVGLARIAAERGTKDLGMRSRPTSLQRVIRRDSRGPTSPSTTYLRPPPATQSLRPCMTPSWNG